MLLETAHHKISVTSIMRYHEISRDNWFFFFCRCDSILSYPVLVRLRRVLERVLIGVVWCAVLWCCGVLWVPIETAQLQDKDQLLLQTEV